MKYDWMAQAYASAPTMSSAGQRHRAKYLKHWSKKSKPEDAVGMAHLDALAYEERRERVKNRLEQRALKLAYAARNAGDGVEEVAVKDWDVGVSLECTRFDFDGLSFPYKPSERVPIIKREGEHVALENGDTFHRKSCYAEHFKGYRSCTNPAFVNGVIDLSKAAVGSKWKTREGVKIVEFLGVSDARRDRVRLRLLHEDGSTPDEYVTTPDGRYWGSVTTHRKDDDWDIIAPWTEPKGA